jgi:acyl-coenzyme A synthetase/AMP-(fatty) acid ligase/acyl carrier protein
VPISHASLYNLVCWHNEAYAVTPADRATQIASSAFDASVWEIWPYLAAGASVHIVGEATRADPARLVRWLAAHEITLSFLPTPLAEAALRERWPEPLALRVLLTGGDKLRRRPQRKLPFRLVNHYGPTENTVVSTFAEISAEGAGPPPIGRPLPNTSVHVLDAELRPVPIGVPGELHVGGVQLAAGYWNRPELSAQKFIDHPFQRGERLYKTGDRVRWLAEGEIEFLGRIDEQVKIRGVRIEPGEIEALLARHRAVREAVVLARDDGGGEARLVAYVVAQDAAAGLRDELRAALRGQLPEAMVPSHFVMLDALPLTPNGKIDRQRLPAPEAALPRREYVRARNRLEEILAGTWAEVLGVERVGIEDNFFELGGHSLNAMQIVSRLHRELRVELPVAELFAAPTIASLSARVEALRGTPASAQREQLEL